MLGIRLKCLFVKGYLYVTEKYALTLTHIVFALNLSFDFFLHLPQPATKKTNEFLFNMVLI